MSKSILEVGVHEALRDIHWDEDSFHERGGVYEWAKDALSAGVKGCNTQTAKDLDW